jgi:hypothetical protein
LAEGQAAAEELFKQLKVSDFLLGTLASLVQLGYTKLGEGETEQTRVAIEALRALMPVLDDVVSADAARDLRQAIANLQLAYASKVNETSDPPDDESKGET